MAIIKPKIAITIHNAKQTIIKKLTGPFSKQIDRQNHKWIDLYDVKKSLIHQNHERPH